MKFLKKIFSGLESTRKNITDSVENVLKNFTKIDEEFFEELEEVLILADVGVTTSTFIIDNLKDKVKQQKISVPSEIKELLKQEIADILHKEEIDYEFNSPTVILVVGVNGVGKTTTIGKLAHNFKKDEKTVMLAAADTFRAAAIDQLEVWSKKINVPLIKHPENSDPSAVVFDAIKSAKAKNIDILICDTAGRLHNKKNLMEELRKILKVVKRDFTDAQIEVVLALDATTGQNALSQAKTFKEVVDITGIALTKLDGTAKGGIVIAIKHELNIPIYYVGLGETIDDLEVFDPSIFANALFGEDSDSKDEDID